MARPLKDQVVVVTGASSGLGREMSLAFARAGSRVVLGARNDKALKSLADEIRQAGGRALVVKTDVTDMDQVDHLAEEAMDTYGRIDTWINNAGVSMYAPFEDATLPEQHRIMDVIYWGSVHGCRAAIPRMKETGGGTLMFIGSVASDVALPLQSTYSAAKHALRGLADALRLELEHEAVPIGICLIKPPSLNTPFFRHAKTKLGVAPAPMPPVYDPSVAVRAILRCAVKPERELLIGGSGEAISLTERLMPRVMDRQLVHLGHSLQETDTPKLADAPSNLFVALDEPGVARDAWGGWRHSWVTWLREHPRESLVGVAAASLALALWRLSIETTD